MEEIERSPRACDCTANWDEARTSDASTPHLLGRGTRGRRLAVACGPCTCQQDVNVHQEGTEKRLEAAPASMAIRCPELQRACNSKNCRLSAARFCLCISGRAAHVNLRRSPPVLKETGSNRGHEIASFGASNASSHSRAQRGGSGTHSWLWSGTRWHPLLPAAALLSRRRQHAGRRRCNTPQDRRDLIGSPS